MGLGLGPFELILVFAVLLLLFGARRLPELATGMGRGIRDFKRAVNGADEQAIAACPHPLPAAPAADRPVVDPARS